jgi:hypothetical protein
MIRDSESGKKEDYNESTPIVPKSKKAKMTMLTATWYFMK